MDQKKKKSWHDVNVEGKSISKASIVQKQLKSLQNYLYMVISNKYVKWSDELEAEHEDEVPSKGYWL